MGVPSWGVAGATTTRLSRNVAQGHGSILASWPTFETARKLQSYSVGVVIVIVGGVGSY